MEDILTKQNIDNTTFSDEVLFDENNLQRLPYLDFQENTTQEFNEDVGLKSKLTNYNEDASSLLDNLFRGKETLLVENWSKVESIQALITLVNEEEVHLDCLIDSENNIIENRAFPKVLFDHLINLSENKTIIIKTSYKAGTIKIDVYSGDGIVNKNTFISVNKWDSLVGQGLDNKLREW